MKIAKLLLVSVFAVLLLSNISFSQAISSGTARFEALGYNPFINDASIDINRNPAWANFYRNYAFGDLGREVVNDFQLTDQFGAVNFGVSKDITLGMVLNKREDRWNDFIGKTFSEASAVEPIVPFKLLFSYTSDKFTLGFAPYITSKSLESKGTNYDSVWSGSSFGAQLGTVFVLDGGWFEAAVDGKFNKIKREITLSGVTNTYKNAGGLQFDGFLRGKFMLVKQMKLSLVPYASVGFYSWNPTIEPTLLGFLETKHSYMNVMGGLGISMPILERGFMAGGLSAGFNSYTATASSTLTDEYKYSAFVFPKFNLGMEWALTDWLVGRLGYSRAVTSDNQKYTDVGVTTEVMRTLASDPVQTITMGLGFQFGRFSIDGTIGEKLLKEGIYTVSGKSNNLFGMLSASYNFNK